MRCDVCNEEIRDGKGRYVIPALGTICIHCAKTKTLEQILDTLTKKRRIKV